MDEFITRHEHDEFARRIDDEQKRQNRRIDLMEENSKQIGSLVISIEKMACNMDVMTKEQKRQGEILDEQKAQIEKIEREPVNTWKKIKNKAIDTVVGVIVGALATGAGLLIATYLK